MAKKTQVMKTLNEELSSDRMKNSTVYNPLFTGLARSVECYDNQGFKNFRILTLHLEQGKVVKMERSDAWANFECGAILEHVNHVSLIHLNNEWTEGEAFKK